MKRLGILNPPLNAAKIGTGTGDFNYGQIFDVGFHDLGVMGLQCLDFPVQGIGYVHKNLGIEILGCRPFEK